MTHLLRRVAAFVSWHRRAVGALLAALSVLTVAQWLSGPGGPTSPVIVAAAAVPAGHTLTEADIASREVPADLIPEGALIAPGDAIGAVTAVALTAGTALQPGLFATARVAPEGWSIVPVRLPDAALRDLLRPGDRVALVVAADERAEVVAGDARVAGVPQTAEATGFSISTGGTDLILVEVPAEQAPTIALLGQTGQLGIVLTGEG